MYFWFFMLAFDLMLPCMMLGFGRYFMHTAPKSINLAFGYRTRRSMQSPAAWAFAHHYFGRIWWICGLIMLPLTAAALAPVWGQPHEVVGKVGVVLIVLQTLPLFVSILLTEKALKKAFDPTGTRR